jgi:hypothetical protein
MQLLDADLHIQDLVWHAEGVLRFLPMSLKYESGEEVQAGDQVRYHDEAAKIEFVAKADDPGTVWYVEQFGGGCMIFAPSFGRVFVSKPQDDEDLEFVSRDESAPIA